MTTQQMVRLVFVEWANLVKATKDIAINHNEDHPVVITVTALCDSTTNDIDLKTTLALECAYKHMQARGLQLLRHPMYTDTTNGSLVLRRIELRVIRRYRNSDCWETDHEVG